MKHILVLCCFLSTTLAAAQIDSLFQRIRTNEAALTAFISAMPKGGDLHHHYSGSVYAETYLQSVIDSDYYFNPATLTVTRDAAADCACKRFSSLKGPGELDACKQKILQKWSVKDYNGVSYPSDKQFFETFPAFGIGADQSWDAGLEEIKHRAVKEHLSYIETMFSSIPCKLRIDGVKAFDERFAAARTNDRFVIKTPLYTDLFTEIEKSLPADKMSACVNEFVSRLESRHKRLALDDQSFMIRYQTYVTRVNPSPTTVFRNLLLAFEAAERSKLIAGVNIVAPEDNEISMRFYELHMLMFRYCHRKFPNVKIALHAGELALGMVRPEDLTWHINFAVGNGAANRIGHGADLPYEYGLPQLLKQMRDSSVAIEINLTSNEFILKLKHDAHPISLYRDAGVPIVICTDDAGVLRTSITRQYVLLAQRYPEISYQEIKKYVHNGIRYSFIEEPELKKRLLRELDEDFQRFERQVLEAGGRK